MNKKEIYTQAEALILRCQTVVLCTQHITGAPDARAMLNLHNPLVFALAQTHMPKNKLFTYISTNFASEKVSQINQNPHACLYYADGKTFEGITVLGTINQVADPHIKNEFWQEDWVQYYPQGKESQDYTLLYFTPKLCKYYNGNFEVWKYEV